MPGIPATFFNLVDIRDVANAHVIALTNPNAPGNRYLCSRSGMWIIDIANVLREEFSPKGYTIPSTEVPSAIIWLASWWDAGAENIYPTLGKKILQSNEKIKNQLGIEFRDVKQSIIDMANDIIKYNL